MPEDLPEDVVGRDVVEWGLDSSIGFCHGFPRFTYRGEAIALRFRKIITIAASGSSTRNGVKARA